MASPTIPAGTGGLQSVSGASATTFVPSKPTSTTSGNVLVAMYYTEATGAITMPTGFTNVVDKLTSGVGSSNPNHTRIDCKIADGTEGSTLTWSWTGSAWRHGVLICCQGTATSGTAWQLANSAGATNTNVTTPPDVALTGNATVDALVLLISTAWSDATSWSAPTGWTLRYNGAGDVMGVISVAQASGGAPAATHVTATGTAAGPSASAVIAIMSPAGGGSSAQYYPFLSLLGVG